MTEEATNLGSDEQFCQSCGEVIKKEAELCPKCGVRLKDVPAGPSERKKGSKFKIGCLSLIGVIALIAIIAAGAASGGGGADTESQPRPRLYPDRPDAQDKDIELAAGALGTLSGWEVTVSFEETAETFGTFDQADQGNHFVVLNAIVKRVGDKSASLMGQNFFSSEFRLLTAAGQVIDPSMSSKKPELVPGDMVSGGQIEGYLTYEVPATPGIHYLLFKPSAFNGARLVWAIEVP